MGMQETKIGWYDAEEVVCLPTNDNTFNSLEFHSDWNWLMSVVVKIEAIQSKYKHNYPVSIVGNRCTIVGHEIEDLFIKVTNINKLESTYRAVVEFIRWYNESNLPPEENNKIN